MDSAQRWGSGRHRSNSCRGAVVAGAVVAGAVVAAAPQAESSMLMTINKLDIAKILRMVLLLTF